MAHLIYKDHEDGKFDYRVMARLSPLKQYLKHWDNMLWLQWISIESDDRVERHQARKEMITCQKRMDFWSRRMSPAEEQDKIRGCEEAKRRWTRRSR